MCGIAGLVSRRHHGDLTGRVEAMTDLLVHRGPDGSGHWIEPHHGVALGQRRLAIVDLTETGRQPMESADGRWVLVYNGELYNTDTVRDRLRADGVVFRGRSDTEVLLEGIARWGVEATVRDVDAMFAFAAWDRQERSLVLGRDRFGEKPLYWVHNEHGFAFASELGPLRSFPGIRDDLDPQAVESFLRLGYVPDPMSILSDVRKLPPASLLRCTMRDDGTFDVATSTYWSAASTIESARSAGLFSSLSESTDALEAALLSSVKRRMVADVPLGAFLSGGLDSSTIVAMMAAQSSDVRTFTIGFEHAAFDESAFAARVASHLGTKHTEVILGEADALAVVPRLASIYDEPFADSSQIPTHLVSAVARRDVTVALSGDGGDELLGGYNRHVFMNGSWPKLQRVPTPLRRLAASTARRLPAERWDQLLRPVGRVRQLPAHVGTKVHKAAGIAGMESSDLLYRHLVSFCSDPRALLRTGWPVGSDASFPALPSGGGVHGLSLAEQAMLADIRGYLPGDILTKVDRAAMATSLETRVPFLDPSVLAICARMPLEHKIVGGKGKVALRNLLERFVPVSLFERPKMGFGIPLAAWLRGPLRSWAEELLHEASGPNGTVFDGAAINALWLSHVSGQADHSASLWPVLMLQQWLCEPRPNRRSS